MSEAEIIPKRDVKKKFLFFVEGEQTEFIYINAIANLPNINQLHDIIVLDRIKKKQSNPLKIVESVEGLVSLIQHSSHSELLDDIHEYLENFDGGISREDFKNKYEDLLAEFNIALTWNDEIDEDLFIDEIEILNRNLHNFKTFRKDFDEVCIIVDRDKQSFKEPQYDDVLEICAKNRFLLGVTNPCIEFYFYMHIVPISQIIIESNEILENKKHPESKRKFVEKCLSKELNNLSPSKGYSKNKPKPEVIKYIIDNYETFKQNIVSLEQCNLGLKNKIGTSLHLIIKQLF